MTNASAWENMSALGGTRTPTFFRSYLYRVQRRPDQSATWEACRSVVRTRSPGAEVVRLGGSQVGSH